MPFSHQRVGYETDPGILTFISPPMKGFDFSSKTHREANSRRSVAGLHAELCSYQSSFNPFQLSIHFFNLKILFYKDPLLSHN